MATRSTICLVLDKSDIGKELKFDESKLPEGIMYSNEYIGKIESVKLSDSVLEIYHHWDGYPEGVGRTLVDKFNTYDLVLNLLLGGDASSIIGDTIIQYCADGGEDWQYVKPWLTNDCLLSESYVYKFENGKWYFKGYADSDWVDLAEYLVGK